MTFLEICREVYKALGLQGTFNDVNASNDTKIISQAVKEGWIDVQNYRKDWKFLQESVTLTLDPAYTEYNLTFIFGSSDNDFGYWDPDNFIYDFQSLKERTYDDWRRLEVINTNEPRYFAVKPNDNSVLFTPLDNNYDVTLDYFKTPQILENNTDVPAFPQAYHTLLLYKGLINASVFFSSPEMYQYAVIRADQLMGQLMREQLPSKTLKQRPLVY